MINKLNESKRNNEVFSSNLLNIINVYSGIVTLPMLNTLLKTDPLTLIVKVKNDNEFVPCTITKENLSEIQIKNPQSIVLEVSSCDELLNNNFFINTFGLNKSKEEKPIKTEEKKEAVVVEPPQHNLIHHNLIHAVGRIPMEHFHMEMVNLAAAA
jgi:hypothetical protein